MSVSLQFNVLRGIFLKSWWAQGKLRTWLSHGQTSHVLMCQVRGRHVRASASCFRLLRAQCGCCYRLQLVQHMYTMKLNDHKRYMPIVTRLNHHALWDSITQMTAVIATDLVPDSREFVPSQLRSLYTLNSCHSERCHHSSNIWEWLLLRSGDL